MDNSTAGLIRVWRGGHREAWRGGLLLAALGCLVTSGAPPANLVVEGIPEAPASLRSAVQRYLEFRTATFQDWHPQRRDVLLTTRFAETAQLHLVRLPGAARKQLTFLSEPVADASFDPSNDGTILFMQDRGGAEFFQLYRFDAAEGRVALLTDGDSRNTGPRWARDGRRVAYSSTRRNGRDTDLYVIEPGRPESDRRVAEMSGSGWQVLDWSPDGRSLLVLAYVSINESYLHLVEVGTGQRRALTPVTGEKVAYGGGRFLPDGRTLVVTTDLGSEFRRLAKLDVATGAVSPLGPEIAWEVEDFGVSPDGRRVAFFANEDGISRLHVRDVATGRERRTPPLPAGVATGLRWHPNNREIGFSLASARVPGDVFSVDVRVNTLTRWTGSETGGLNAARLAEPEWVRLKAPGGVALSGFLYRPDAQRFPGPRPVLLVVHGGPEAQSRPGYQGRWNYLLEELGVALLYPNVRGSAGYGKTFLTLDNGRKREDSVRDLGVFLDWIGQDARLDASRVGVYGGSYDGYMVLASLVRHGERLRCGIDVVGISNFRTFLERTQDYRRDLRRAEYGDERDPAMREFLERISPLTQVARIRKPLLVVQGRNDPRVPLSEAKQLVKALRDQGGKVGYLMATDEGHGFKKKSNLDFMFLSIVQFLEENLVR